jgi:hypothetical protein
MAITFLDQLPNKNEYFSLFNTTGWNKAYQAGPDDLERANRSSWLVVSAFDDSRWVDFGRVVTDFVLHAAHVEESAHRIVIDLKVDDRRDKTATIQSKKQSVTDT